MGSWQGRYFYREVCSGSVRRDANTEILLDEAMAGFRELRGEVELIRLGDLNIGPCRGCLSCERDGRCVQNDDMATLLAKSVANDGMILASPVYFWSVSGLAKTFIDHSLRGKLAVVFWLQPGPEGLAPVRWWSISFICIALLWLEWQSPSFNRASILFYRSKLRLLDPENTIDFMVEYE